MPDDGWIKLYKSLEQWEWWDDAVMVRSYISILLRASWKPFRWHGRDFDAGQFVTSLAHLAQDMRLSVHRVRTVLDRLQNTGEISVVVTTQYTVITVLNWKKHQSDSCGNQDGKDNALINNAVTQNDGKQTANGWQTDGKQMATSKTKEDFKDLNTPRVRARARETVPAETCLTFEKFWDMYGKKVDREKCRAKFEKIPEADRKIILERLPLYISMTPEITYRKNPQTWINGKCWNDEMTVSHQPDASRQVFRQCTFAADGESGAGKQDWEGDYVQP